MVGLPADDVAGVLRHQLRRARVHVHAVHVEDLGIALVVADQHMVGVVFQVVLDAGAHAVPGRQVGGLAAARVDRQHVEVLVAAEVLLVEHQDRKSTRLNSSHSQISYAVFCLKKKKKEKTHNTQESLKS